MSHVTLPRKSKPSAFSLSLSSHLELILYSVHQLRAAHVKCISAFSLSDLFITLISDSDVWKWLVLRNTPTAVEPKLRESGAFSIQLEGSTAYFFRWKGFFLWVSSEREMSAIWVDKGYHATIYKSYTV